MFDFTTRREFWEAAWTWGFTGRDLAECLNELRRALRRPLTDGERSAATEGHDFGAEDKARYDRDMHDGVYTRPRRPVLADADTPF